MPTAPSRNRLSTYFSFAGQADSAGAYFWGLLKDLSSSLDCHLEMIELFATALGLHSKRFRGKTIEFPQKKIPDQSTLNLIMNQIPKDLTQAAIQILFEDFCLKKDSAGVAYSVETAKDERSFDKLKADYQALHNFTLAQNYNQIRKNYQAWPDAKSLPPEYAQLKIQNAPKDSDITDKLTKLKQWIESNDPNLVALATLAAKASLSEKLDFVFPSPPSSPPIDLSLFCDALLDQIYLNNKKHPNINHGKSGITARKFLLEALDSKKQELGQCGQGYKTLIDRVDAVGELKTEAKIFKLFENIKKLFQMGVSNNDSKAIQIIKAIFMAFSLNCGDQGAFLIKQINAICHRLKNSLNPDPDFLKEYHDTLSRTPPQQVPVSVFQLLCEASLDALSDISLNLVKFQPPFDRISRIQLFSFTDYATKPRNSDYFYLPAGETLGTTNNIIASLDLDEGIKDHQDYLEYSRPFYDVFTATDPTDPKAAKTILKFYNVIESTTNTPAKKIYFFDGLQPTKVMTKLFDKNKSQSLSSYLEIDFQAASINGEKQIPKNGKFGGKSGDKGVTITSPAANTAYETANNKQILYDVVKQISKWQSFTGKQSYDVLYEISPDSAQLDSHLIWRMPGGRGLNRADKVDDDLYLVKTAQKTVEQKQAPTMTRKSPRKRGRGPEPEIETSVLLRILEFDSASRILAEDADEVNAIRDKSFQYSLLSQPKTDPNQRYCLTNTPGPKLPAAVNHALSRNSATAVDESAAKILESFDFEYYRKMERDKIIKRLYPNQTIHRPKTGDGIGLAADQGAAYTKIGIDLPISFRNFGGGHINKNSLQAKYLSVDLQHPAPTLKNKGSQLTRQNKPRKPAGNVMAGLTEVLDPAYPQESSLSATEFAEWAILKSKSLRKAWNQMKDNNQGKDIFELPVDEEWCHLRGHGDGGEEHLGNFVSGSYHCNTEQLAMEAGLRATSHTFAQGTSLYTLRTTAYLFQPVPSLLKPNANYLTNDNTFQDALPIYNQLRKPVPPAKPKDNAPGTTAPLARFIRYKIYKNQNGATLKLFDHLFEAQSEFIDEKQFEILSKAVQFALAGQDAFKEWYIKQAAALEASQAKKLSAE